MFCYVRALAYSRTEASIYNTTIIRVKRDHDLLSIAAIHVLRDINKVALSIDNAAQLDDRSLAPPVVLSTAQHARTHIIGLQYNIVTGLYTLLVGGDITNLPRCSWYYKHTNTSLLYRV